MKVLFGNYCHGYLLYGGAEVQLENTRDALLKLGITVELYSQWRRDVLDGVDILHWFHIDPASIHVLQAAKKRGIRTVISSIFWPTRPRLEAIWTRATTLPRLLGFPSLTSQWLMMRDVLSVADVVITSSDSESAHIRRIFGVPAGKLKVVPLGVSSWFAGADPGRFIEKYGLKDFVLCVGRVEPRKNQVRLLQALRNTDMAVVLIGDYSVNPGYYQQCLAVGHPRAYFLGSLSHDDELLRSAYAAAQVLVMPSLFETPGLVALEAALAGCRIAVTCGGNTKEYFKDFAEYVDPHSCEDIRNGALRAAHSPAQRVQEFRELILSECTWEAVGCKIMSIYKELLGNRVK